MWQTIIDGKCATGKNATCPTCFNAHQHSVLLCSGTIEHQAKRFIYALGTCWWERVLRYIYMQIVVMKSKSNKTFSLS